MKNKYGSMSGIPVTETHSKNVIQYAIPLGKEQSAFKLTKHPEPEKKSKPKTE